MLQIRTSYLLPTETQKRIYKQVMDEVVNNYEHSQILYLSIEHILHYSYLNVLIHAKYRESCHVYAYLVTPLKFLNDLFRQQNTPFFTTNVSLF